MKRKGQMILPLVCVILTAAICAGQTQQPEPAANVISGTVAAIGYPVGGGGTKVNMVGTATAPQASGEAKVDAKAAGTGIDLKVAARAQAHPDVPVFQITPVESTIKFGVKASVPIEGTFKKWDATVTFSSTAVETGVLAIKIDAASVDTGSGMKDGKLRGKDFFDVKQDPYITFKSTKIV